MQRRATIGYLLACGTAWACSSTAPAPPGSVGGSSSASAGTAAGGGGQAGSAVTTAGSGIGGLAVPNGGASGGGSGEASGASGGVAAAGGGAGGSGGASVSGNGGASGSAGTAGSSGAAGAAGGSACSGVFCEDFEQGVIDPSKWDLTQGNGGTAVVQQELVAHGKYALQVHGLASAKDDYALIVTKSGPEALKGAHFGRANFYITPKPLTSGHTQMVFAGRNGGGSANGPGPFNKLRYLEVSNINGGWQFGFDLLDIAPLVEEVYYPAGSPKVPTVTWSCLEWQFTDEPDTASVWVDGSSLGTFDDKHVSYPGGHAAGSPLYNGTSSDLIGGFNLFGFGFHDWHPNQPFDLYYDDIVLDTQRVGCVK